MKKQIFTVGAMAVLAFAVMVVSLPGCRGNVGRAIHELKELEPKAKQRNEEIRKMTGVPEEPGE